MLLNIAKIKDLWERLLHQEASPNQIASGFALGLFTSFLPFPGLQTLLALGVAFIFRTNKVACLLGLNLHLILLPVIPLIFWVEYEIGRILFNRDAPAFDPASFNFHDLFRQGWWYFYLTLIGSLMVGLPISLAAFWGVKRVVIRWQKARQDQNDKANGIPLKSNKL